MTWYKNRGVADLRKRLVHSSSLETAERNCWVAHIIGVGFF
jgi:hypothetical protein